MNELFQRAYGRIRGTDTTMCGTDTLCAMARLEIAVYTAVSVRPWLDATYGTRAELRARIRSIFDALGPYAARESEIEEKIRIQNIRFELSNCLNDPAYENLVTDEACRLCAYAVERDNAGCLVPADREENVVTAGLCQLLTVCYFLTQEAEYAQAAKTIAGSWEKDLQANGAWSLTVDEALQRLFAAHLYRIYTFDEDFDAMLRLGTGYCLRLGVQSALPNAVPTDTEAETACRMADLFTLIGFGNEGKPLENVLQTSLGLYLQDRLGQNSLTPRFLRVAAAYGSLLSEENQRFR